MKMERHIMALLKFLKMFTVFLVRLGLCSSTCFISSLLIFTAVIGVTCFIITLFFPVTIDIIPNTALRKEIEPVLSELAEQGPQPSRHSACFWDSSWVSVLAQLSPASDFAPARCTFTGSTAPV